MDGAFNELNTGLEWTNPLKPVIRGLLTQFRASPVDKSNGDDYFGPHFRKVLYLSNGQGCLTAKLYIYLNFLLLNSGESVV